MKRAILTAVIALLAPTVALAAGFTANLTGSTGSGLAVITIDGTAIDYNILVSGLADPNSALISNGATTVDLAPAFVGGSAFGSVTSGNAQAIAANPAAWTVTVGNGSATISGALAGASDGVALYFPVAASIQGQVGTFFKTDGRFVNRSGQTANLTVEYYAEGAAGHAAPTASAAATIAPNEQLVVDDAVNALFGISNGKGAMIVRSDATITGDMRIYNDQTAAGEGTFGQFVRGAALSQAAASGILPFLSNEPSGTGEGFRANVGWFNPNAAPAEVTLNAWAADGSLLGTLDHTAAGLAQEQFNVGGLWSALQTVGDFYITFTADAPVFMYASVVDNVNGDAIYVPAVPLD